jgi:hypothetical protein
LRFFFQDARVRLDELAGHTVGEVGRGDVFLVLDFLPEALRESFGPLYDAVRAIRFLFGLAESPHLALVVRTCRRGMRVLDHIATHGKPGPHGNVLGPPHPGLGGIQAVRVMIERLRESPGVGIDHIDTLPGGGHPALERRTRLALPPRLGMGARAIELTAAVSDARLQAGPQPTRRLAHAVGVAIDLRVDRHHRTYRGLGRERFAASSAVRYAAPPRSTASAAAAAPVEICPAAPTSLDMSEPMMPLTSPPSGGDGTDPASRSNESDPDRNIIAVSAITP